MCCQETSTLEPAGAGDRGAGPLPAAPGRARVGLGRRADRLLPLGPLLAARVGLRGVRGDRRLGEAIRSVIGDEVPAGVVVVRVDQGGGLAGRRRARPARDRGPHGGDRRRRRLRRGRRSAAHRRRAAKCMSPPRGAAVETIDLDGARPGVHGRARTTRFWPSTVRCGPSAAAELRLAVPPLRALVGHRRQRRGLVPGRRAGEVGRPPPAVLPRPRRDPHRAGRTAARRLHPGPGVRPDGGRRGPGGGRDARRRVRPAAAVRPGGRRLVRRRPARPHELQRRPGLHPGRRGPHAARRGAPPDQPAWPQPAVTSLRLRPRAARSRSAGADLPWSTDDTVARMGVEYRNDLLGHVHALGPSGPPSRYYTGHERSDHPEDWPPNKAACEELRSLGATVGYAHPALEEFPDDWSTERFFAIPRSVEARELVADAALGVVDSVDLISPSNDEGAVFLYHRLLSCGLRLAATAGTDVFLSFSHGPGVALQPARLGPGLRASRRPGLVGGGVQGGHPGRAHGGHQRPVAHSRGERAGTRRGARPGSRRPARRPGPRAGSGRRAPDARRAGRGRGRGRRGIRAAVRDGWSNGPTWIAAVARGGSHPNTLDESVLAHTSPVYVDVAGRRVGRAADASGAWSSSTRSSGSWTSTATSLRRPATNTSATLSLSSTRLAPSTVL